MQLNEEDTENQSLISKSVIKKKNGVNETHNDQSTVDQELVADLDARKKKYIRYGVIGGVVLIIVILAIVIPLSLRGKKKPDNPPSPPPVPPVPIDVGINYYMSQNETRNAYSLSGYLTFNDTNVKAVESVQKMVAEKLTQLDGEAADPKLTNPIGVDWKQTIMFGPNNRLVKNLKYTFDMLDFKVARLELTDADTERFSIPQKEVEKKQSNWNMRLDMVGHTMVTKDTNSNNPFAFAFKDNLDDSNVLLSTEGRSLVFSDRYIQMDFNLPSRHCYGFGERMQQFELQEGAWGMWSSGSTRQDQLDSGLGRGGSFGVHPFMMVRTKNVLRYIGIYFRNSNAQLPILRFNNQNILSYITLGGQLEAYFFISGSPREVIQSYQRLFGKPYLPPFWALGWQEATPQTVYDAKNGFEGDNQTTLNATVNKYYEMALPLETIYLDQKLYSQKKNFELRSDLMPKNISEMRKWEHFQNLRIVGYLDPTIIKPENVTTKDSENTYYIDGNAYGIFVKSLNENGKYNGNLIGVRGSQQCVYIDWFRYSIVQTFWNQAIETYITTIPVDGLWTQNNEATNDVQGEVLLKQQSVALNKERMLQASTEQFDTTWYSVFNSTSNSTYYLPFIPLFNQSGPYDQNAMSLNGTHQRYLDIPNKTESEYNLHSLYGHAMIRTTNEAVKYLVESNTTSLFDRRPFLLTRASFTGTNRYASYAIKSKYRSWASLQNAIPRLQTMQMMGFAHSGADACGLIEESGAKLQSQNEELCLRWIQLSTFFPLARHSQDFSENAPFISGPLGFTDQTKMRQVQVSMRDRMQFLRFMYTCLFEASEFGGTCIDPLFYHYPNDLLAIQNVNQSGVNETFIFGGAVKVSPIVQPLSAGQKTFKSHFPKGRWVNLDTFEVLDSQAKDDLYDLPVSDLGTVAKHLRPGSLIPWQNLDITNKDYTKDRVNSTSDLLKRSIQLVLNRNEKKTAQGTVFLDGGLYQSEIDNKRYEYYTINHKANKSIQFELTQGKLGSQDINHKLDSIFITDAADLSKTDFACAYTQQGSIIEMETQFIGDKNVLKIQLNQDSLEYPLKFSKVVNIFYGNSDTDLNLCKELSFEYRLDPIYSDPVSLAKELIKTETSMRLIHKKGILPDLNLTLRVYDEGIVNVRWTWMNPGVNNSRMHYEIPEVLVNTTHSSRKNGTDAIGKHIIISVDPFKLEFTQQQGQTPVYFEIDRMIYGSYLNWVGMRAYSQKGDKYRGILGLGERSQKDLFYKDGVYSMWNYDSPTKAEDGVPPGDQAYGTHPFFMWKHSDFKWVGVFFKQAHAQDWIIENFPDQGITQLKQVATGGITDIYVILNSNTPDSVVSYYHRIVGKPFLPPQWALGWHQCKYCLYSVEEYRDVIENYNKYRIPLDAQWADIDYMDQYRDFTVDFANFGNLTNYTVNYLQKNNTLKFVPIVDAGIAYKLDDSYRTFTEGKDKNVFLMSNKTTGEIFVGNVWPKEAAFPDFFHPNTQDWWSNELTQFHEQLVPFDGLWLDMNEAANFCNGACLNRQKVSQSALDQLIYTPTGRSLEAKSLPVDLVHEGGRTQLDAHNYYGAHQTYATYTWYKKWGGKRPFIIERSSFAGLGKYAGKWLGDNSATYEDMQRSVTGVMMMNIFGIPFAGADICGFTGPDTTPYLCARWHQLGALYPFSRNHRDCDNSRQEPYQYAEVLVNGTNTTVMEVMRDAILVKYSLIRYFYTQLFTMSKLDTDVGTLFKPLFFAFPNDPLAYEANPSENVMIGPALKLSIKLTPEVNMVNETNFYYLPAGWWCDILHPKALCIESKGNLAEFDSGIKDYQLHLKEGEILVYQDAKEIANLSQYNSSGLRSEYLQQFPIDLHIHPMELTDPEKNISVSYIAKGTYINDNGIDPEVTPETYNEYSILFSYNDKKSENNTDDEYIRLFIGLQNAAFKYYSNETKCSQINMNDMLGRIYIYAEQGFFRHREYVLGLIKTDQTYDELGVTYFDPETNRIVFDPKDPVNQYRQVPVCLGSVQEIDFRPAIDIARQ